MGRSTVKGTASSSEGRECRRGDQGGPAALPLPAEPTAPVCLQSLLLPRGRKTVFALAAAGTALCAETNAAFWSSSLPGGRGNSRGKRQRSANSFWGGRVELFTGAARFHASAVGSELIKTQAGFRLSPPGEALEEGSRERLNLPTQSPTHLLPPPPLPPWGSAFTPQRVSQHTARPVTKEGWECCKTSRKVHRGEATKPETVQHGPGL